MRTDVFIYHSEKNLEQYFFYTELADELMERGRNNVYASKLKELAEKQQALDAKYYSELRNTQTDKWFNMKRQLNKIKQFNPQPL